MGPTLWGTGMAERDNAADCLQQGALALLEQKRPFHQWWGLTGPANRAMQPEVHQSIPQIHAKRAPGKGTQDTHRPHGARRRASKA